MKKILSIVACTLLTGTMASTAIAAGQVNGDADALTALTITNDNDSTGTGGPDLEFNPSPNVAIGAFTTATAYSIISTNFQTTQATGMEYGILSADTGYYQRTKTIDAEVMVTEPTATTALPGDNWNYVGTGDGSNS